MSVVNKMLRDLDQRAQEQGGAGVPRTGPVLVTLGTASVNSLLVVRTTRHGGRWGIAVCATAVLLGGAIGAVWWSGRNSDGQPAPALPHAAMDVPAATSGGAARASPQAVQDNTSTAMAAPMSGSPLAPTSGGVNANNVPIMVPAQAVPPVAKPAQARAVAAHSLPPDPAPAAPAPAAVGIVPATAQAPVVRLPATASPAVPPAASVLLAASAQPSPTTPPPVAMAVQAQSAPAQWQDAALEAVGQAQRMWAGGARDGAVELLRDALQVLERTHGAELASTGAAATLAMVRELARMELAQGHADAVLALLQRHERLLSGRADLWALRANAAQRAGLHAQASQAYQTALKIRPGEPRWMLGAAVSLAAMGQLQAAAELGEQARAIEAASPEVLAYLRQLGVPLRDR